MLSNAELKSSLNEKLAEDVAADIVDTITRYATPENLEVDFRISEGRMVGSLDSPNTWFKIDCPTGTTVEKAKSIIAEVFGEDFDAENKEQFDRMEERKAICDDFRELVRMILNSGIYHEQLANALRKVALGDIQAFLVPIDVIRFLSIDLGEASNDDFLLTIQKVGRVDPATGQWLSPPQSVNDDLFKTYRETGMDFNDIVKKRHEENDPRYELVAGVVRKRYSFELHCDIAADYSFCEPPANVRKPIGS